MNVQVNYEWINMVVVLSTKQIILIIIWAWHCHQLGCHALGSILGSLPCSIGNWAVRAVRAGPMRACPGVVISLRAFFIGLLVCLGSKPVTKLTITRGSNGSRSPWQSSLA